MSSPLPRLLPRARQCLKTHPLRYSTTRTFTNRTPLHAPFRNNHKALSDLDAVSYHRLQAETYASSKRRAYISAAGATTCFLATLLVISLYDVPSTNPVDKCEAPPSIGSFDGKIAESAEVVETGTSHVPVFPKTIKLPSKGTKSSVSPALPAGTGDVSEEEYQLLGLGIRTVSFLSIQVYVVGFYVAKNDLTSLQAKFVRKAAEMETASALVAGEKEKLRADLLDGEKSAQIWDEVLRENGIRSVFRIVPTRNTDLSHLRDSWVTAVTARSKDPKRLEKERFDDESFGLAMGEFKKMFSTGKRSVAKGKVILFERDTEGVLSGWVQAKNSTEDDLVALGEVKDERISRLVWEGYLGGSKVSSEPARRSIVDGILDIVERPLGTVETQVV